MPDAVRLGYWLSSEEHAAHELVALAGRAEGAGFGTAMISDHLHPWVRAQGHAGHVWTTLGAIAERTDRLQVGTGVTAMVHRNHPINVAHAAATAAVLFGDRFFLGVGSGERLNEGPFVARWPRAGERRTRMGEAIDVIRALWRGGNVNHDGEHWRVEHLQLWELPAAPPPIYVAASGRRSAALAGERGDGMIAIAPDARLVETYRGAGGDGPRIAQVHVSLAASRDDALDVAWRWWPNGAIAGSVLSELARPQQFEAIAAATERTAVEDTVVCAVDASAVVAAIDRYVGAGFDSIYLHQVGPDQDRLMDMATTELLPHYRAG
jgi:coenzyme F420-dependent glucose-6-phosphate dehydrogenase